MEGQAQCELNLSDVMKKSAMLIAHETWQNMHKRIDSIIKICMGFNNNVYEWNDYRSEAFIACYDAILSHSAFRPRNPNSKFTPPPDMIDDIDGITRMKIETYAYWYIYKRLFAMAHCEEINYHVHRTNGEYIQTLSNNEYRKRKKSLEQQGCMVRSTRTTYRFSELSSEKDGKIREYSPVFIKDDEV